ncbi:hypothetical protein TONV_019 [Tipula oleracea nudivirus]|uniref:Uncharacterized protein n=1 Tax=Tipula oleracea nudivirus TaxID=1546257 RepID=A0A0B4VFK6_9VIRU|nr:hypothetical protein TONV_019 [Tipula oleracea nudivirus]AJD20079.1 hypothetical protein TONV_019 [Tipula oleracea nudivirus]
MKMQHNLSLNENTEKETDVRIDEDDSTKANDDMNKSKLTQPKTQQHIEYENKQDEPTTTMQRIQPSNVDRNTAKTSILNIQQGKPFQYQPQIGGGNSNINSNRDSDSYSNRVDYNQNQNLQNIQHNIHNDINKNRDIKHDEVYGSDVANDINKNKQQEQKKEQMNRSDLARNLQQDQQINRSDISRNLQQDQQMNKPIIDSVQQQPNRSTDIAGGSNRQDKLSQNEPKSKKFKNVQQNLEKLKPSPIDPQKHIIQPIHEPKNQTNIKQTHKLPMFENIPYKKQKVTSSVEIENTYQPTQQIESKTQNNQKPTTSIIGGIDRGDNEPISTTNNEHNNSSNEKLTTENKKNEQNIITNSNTDDITRVQSVNRNSNNFNKPPLPPQRINIDPNLNTPTVRTQYYNSADTNLIKNSEQLNNNTMQKNNIQSQELLRNQRNAIKGGIDEDQNPNITMLQQPQGGQTQPVFNMDTPPNPNDYKMNTDFQNAMNVYKSYQQNKNLNLEQPNGKPPQMYADDTTATNKYRYLYPTMIFIPLVVIILLIIASSAQLALKIFIVILLIFVLVIYYIQQYNPNVMKYFNKNKTNEYASKSKEPAINIP